MLDLELSRRAPVGDETPPSAEPSFGEPESGLEEKLKP